MSKKNRSDKFNRGKNGRFCKSEKNVKKDSSAEGKHDKLDSYEVVFGKKGMSPTRKIFLNGKEVQFCDLPQDVKKVIGGVSDKFRISFMEKKIASLYDCVARSMDDLEKKNNEIERLKRNLKAVENAETSRLEFHKNERERLMKENTILVDRNYGLLRQIENLKTVAIPVFLSLGFIIGYIVTRIFMK